MIGVDVGWWGGGGGVSEVGGLGGWGSKCQFDSGAGPGNVDGVRTGGGVVALNGLMSGRRSSGSSYSESSAMGPDL